MPEEHGNGGDGRTNASSLRKRFFSRSSSAALTGWSTRITIRRGLLVQWQKRSSTSAVGEFSRADGDMIASKRSALL